MLVNNYFMVIIIRVSKFSWTFDGNENKNTNKTKVEILLDENFQNYGSCIYVTIHAKRGLIRFFDGIEVFWFSKMP